MSNQSEAKKHQSEAKKHQQYVDKAITAVCGTCYHYNSVISAYKLGSSEWSVETNRRCTIGGFAVKKNGTCKMHKFRENNHV